MPRKPRNTPAGYIYHVINRAAGRVALFRKPEDYAAFERVILLAHQRVPLPILDWCIMKNHWHFVVQPRTDDQITEFFRWLTNTHAMRWRVARRTVGRGHLYQSRFKAFPIQSDPLRCPNCGGTMRIISFVEAWQQDLIRKILEHCGLWRDAPARAPPKPFKVARPEPSRRAAPGTTCDIDPDYLEHKHREQFEQPDLPWE